MSRHERKCNHAAWEVLLRKWCYDDEKKKAALEGREPNWLDTLKCQNCEEVDVRPHDPQLPPPTPRA
jgi:hypothetical protein